MPVSGDDFRNLVRRARYREAPSSGSMAGDPGPPQSIAQTGKMGAWADEQGRFSDHATAHSKHRIATAPFQRGVHRTGPSCVSFEETQATHHSRVRRVGTLRMRIARAEEVIE